MIPQPGDVYRHEYGLTVRVLPEDRSEVSSGGITYYLAEVLKSGGIGVQYEVGMQGRWPLDWADSTWARVSDSEEVPSFSELLEENITL